METKFIETHDLANVLNLIDVAAKRGMFNGDQLSVIGAMRERFLNELKQQAPAEDNVSNLESESTAFEVSAD
jgi:hypothetical protein